MNQVTDHPIGTVVTTLASKALQKLTKNGSQKMDNIAFEGDRAAVRSFIRSLPAGTYYTYELKTPDGVPFYVGKGKGERLLHHEIEAIRNTAIHKSNPFKCNKINQILQSGHYLVYRIDRVFGDNEIACLFREEELIGRYKRRCDGGSLTNLAPGLGSLSSADPLTRQRHAATLSGVVPGNPERTTLNLFLQSLGRVDSVPIKPLSEYRSRLVGAYPSPKNLKNASIRNGLTIIASILACNLKLQPSVVVPRRFSIAPELENWPLADAPPEHVDAIIENGAASDILKLDLVSLIPASQPEDEKFSLDAEQVRRVITLVGTATLKEWNLI